MKKTVLLSSILIALTAGTASAASIYSEDGIDVDVHGAAEVQIYQGHEFGDEKTDLDVRLDDGNLNFSTSIAINENLNAIGYFDADFESGEYSNSDLYVGLEGGFGTIKVGRTVTVYDDIGIDKSYEFGGASVGSVKLCDDCETLDLTVYDSGEDAIRYDLDLGNVYFAIATDLERDNDSHHVDGKIGAKFGNFDARVFAQQGESKNDLGEFDINAQGVEVEFNQDAVSLAAGYYNLENKYDGATAGSQSIQLAGSYTMDMTTFAAGVDLYKTTKDLDKIAKVEGTNYYVTVTQKLHSNVKMYGEIGYKDQKAFGKSEDSFAYVAGLEVKF